NGSVCAFHTGDSKIELFRLPSLQKAADLQVPGQVMPGQAIKFRLTPRGDLLAVSSDSSVVRIIDWQNQKQIAELAAGPSSSWTHIAFSPDGQRVALNTFNGCRVFDVRSAALLSDDISRNFSEEPFDVRWTDDDFLVWISRSGACGALELPEVKGPVPDWLP